MQDQNQVDKDKPVLVTGVSGFVGSAVARSLAEQGYKLRGMVRPSSPLTNIRDFPGEIVYGDLDDPPSLREPLSGCGALIHVAADYRLWAPDSQEIIRHNRQHTQAIMTAALYLDIKRIVYTSSVATLAPGHGHPSDETRPLTPERAIGAYKRSKVEAERLVERMIAEQGLPAVIVNPSTPIGPGDVKPTPTGRIIVEAATGKMPAYVNTGLNLAHVDDVADGHVKALEKGIVGERYILGGTDVPLGLMLAEIARQVGRKPPKIALPRWPLFPLAWGAEAFAKLTKIEPFVTRDALKMAGYHMYFSSKKAERLLGYKARPWQQAITDALQWFREEGML
ncbi:MAG: hopanoid-associated sugar epimerase [Zymomonas mobilis subsp. pomaceae]|uniref:Hopanoid-associated sugar epimerase n=1 Tax=Zymomonas mobilis subsp. pomaceae (strain ATCC 29192 / DSM 22645 / JCM 10191 / CCUG 17912 / NBRC 13757 / NCIMB 11200 / NRRL B-4491 / Barker I) TaxID=579138 RepID=F8EV13_ZYMMT|nr:hopanoid-associated sugar epimerase [Zymomonas mobilis]AEI37301.1 hopanoid-associated sugar epimerase [Zymomonas mobilis subsp. pomaceae ATCC 29192]MDX5948670.1 NAD-dependent epimerase/dehydratase family protein [Zymomonas mobilis subsp. pomaceae]GEB88475.1 hypothetical protein ZMO02_01120 [Zymomonas mobilis subsp. pomaceae]